MLALLKIRNLALVDNLVWEPQPGFLGITGETGAGKSVIMGGISLVLGERADKGLIRSGETQCSVEALFHLADATGVNTLLEEAGAPPCEEGELIIRRVITPAGNRQFINSTPVTLNLLRRIGPSLVDMHHPEAHRSLASQSRQLSLLDAFAEDAPQLAAYHAAYASWLAAQRAWRDLQEQERTNERELDFLRHQVAEIEEAAFTRDEVANLETRWQRARNAERLRGAAHPMEQMLDSGEEALLPRLRQLVRLGNELSRLDSSCDAWLAPLAGTVEDLEAIHDQVQDYLSRIEDDPAALAELENRIGQLDTLKRKYGADLDEIEAHLAECRARLDAIDNRDARLAELEAAEKTARNQRDTAAEALTEARRKAAPRLERDFLAHAEQLGFRQSLFRAQLNRLPVPGPEGAEEVDFLFGPNPGEPLKPLRLIASSGEMARVMLALKSALANQDDTPLLVFDEIDANVGGEIARAVGFKMRELGRGHQVIAITHFPQVAALADHHYLISKGLSSDGRTVSSLREVDGDARVAELVRMLGTHGDAAEAHARGLLSTGA